MLIRAQEPCEGRGGRSGLPVPKSPYGLCGRTATLDDEEEEKEEEEAGKRSALRSYVKFEVAVLDSRSLIVLYGLCGRKVTLNLNSSVIAHRSLTLHHLPPPPLPPVLYEQQTEPNMISFLPIVRVLYCINPFTTMMSLKNNQ